MTLASLRRSTARAFVAAALLLALSWWMTRRLPPPAALLNGISAAPVQGPTDRAPFDFDYEGKRCSVRPVASYELQGLVVSHNDIHALADIYHDETSVDTRDLCVVWGANLERGSYLEAKFWSGPFTCYYSTPGATAFDRTALSNNHLITDRPELRSALSGVHRGDQVRVRGLLVDYRMDDWGDFWRRTSTVRNDSDCEVIFFEELEVVARHAAGWHAARRLAKALLAALPVAWLALAILEARSGRSSLGHLS